MSQSCMGSWFLVHFEIRTLLTLGHWDLGASVFKFAYNLLAQTGNGVSTEKIVMQHPWQSRALLEPYLFHWDVPVVHGYLVSSPFWDQNPLDLGALLQRFVHCLLEFNDLSSSHRLVSGQNCLYTGWNI